MTHKGLMEELQKAIHTGNEMAITELIRGFGLPVDEYSNFELIKMALEEGHENISRILVLNSFRIGSMERDLLEWLIELALEREYIRFLVLLVDKAILHIATNKLNNSLFYYISNIENKVMKNFIINTMTNLSGINASDTENFELLELFIGIIRNDYSSFKKFKKMNININKSIVAKSSTLNGYTALHVAVLCENQDFLQNLLKFGSKTCVQDAEGLSPIHHCLKIKNTNVQKALCCAFLLEDDPANPIDHRGISHFHIACMVGSASKAKRYLQNSSDVNHRIRNDTRHYSGYTPLHLAVNVGSARLVQLLLKYGAVVSMKNAKGMSPLHLALFLNKYKIVDLLLTAHVGILENPVDHRGVSHFHIACFRGNMEVVKMFLLNSCVALDAQVYATSLQWPLYSALHFAVLSSCTFIIKLLLNKGANPNCQDSEGFTPLNLACFHGLAKSAEVLLEFKADLNIQNKRGSMPLQTAIKKGNYNIVKRLVEEGVDLNSKDNWNERPPLITAAFFKQFKIMHYLLKNGANAAAKQRDGKTALHILALPESVEEGSSECFTFEEQLSTLRNIGYSSFDLQRYRPDKIDDYMLYVAVEILINEGCDINARDERQCTPLHLACEFSRADLIIVLLQNGADIGVLNKRIRLTAQYINCLHMPIANILYNHIKKLKYAGCRLSSLSINKCYLDSKLKPRFFLSNVPSWMQVQYDKELDQMKNETIDNYSSLYDFLIKDPDDLLAYTKNSILMEYVFHYDFKNVMYPEFGALIQANLRAAKKRATLFMFARKSMQLFTKVPLPDACSFNIFRYLNEEDVKQLILAL